MADHEIENSGPSGPILVSRRDVIKSVIAAGAVSSASYLFRASTVWAQASAPGAVEIADRRDAIRRTVAELRPGDVLLIAGKGHESGQIVGDRVLPFTDHEAVLAALEERVA